MRIHSRFFIAGLLCVVIVEIRNTLGDSGCKTNGLSRDCTRKGLTAIPQDLDMNIEELDVSFNPIEELREDDFKRYPNLVNLRLHGLTSKQEIVFQPNVFSHLKHLEKLDLSESPFNVYADQLIWPEKLTHLNVGGLPSEKFKSLNLSTLTQLGDLNASLNHIESFPVLHPTTPIYWIDYLDNPLGNVTAEELAPYCLLRYFRIRVAKGLLHTPAYSCICRRLEQWMLKHKIEGFKFSCVGVPKTDPCQPGNFSDEMYRQRKACLDRQPTPRFWKILVAAVLLSLLVPAAFGGFMFYKTYKRMKESSGTSTADSSGDDSAPADADAGDASEPSPDS